MFWPWCLVWAITGKLGPQLLNARATNVTVQRHANVARPPCSATIASNDIDRSRLLEGCRICSSGPLNFRFTLARDFGRLEPKGPVLCKDSEKIFACGEKLRPWTCCVQQTLGLDAVWLLRIGLVVSCARLTKLMYYPVIWGSLTQPACGLNAPRNMNTNAAAVVSTCHSYGGRT